MAIKQIYPNLGALESVKKVLGEAGEAIKDKSRTIETSSMPEVLGGIVGGTIGVGVGLTLVYVSGTVVGVSAAGITSGLAALGAIIGGGMLAGIAVAAVPVGVLGVGGYALVARRNKRKLIQAKEALLQEALQKHDAIIREMNERVSASEERVAYLTSLITLLEQAIKDLKADLHHAR